MFKVFYPALCFNHICFQLWVQTNGLNNHNNYDVKNNKINLNSQSSGMRRQNYRVMIKVILLNIQLNMTLDG